jgi:hypothetical protein
MKKLLILAALAASLVIPGSASARGIVNPPPSGDVPICYVVIGHRFYQVSCWATLRSGLRIIPPGQR